jgi:ankyrin repeat protein
MGCSSSRSSSVSPITHNAIQSQPEACASVQHDSSKTDLGELFIDIIPIVAAMGYAHEVRLCRYLCTTTYRVVQKGATADMILRSIERQIPSLNEDRLCKRRIYEGQERTSTLIRAVMDQDARLCNKLLCAGASIDLQSQYNYTALHIACNKGDLEVVKVLCFFKASVFFITSQGFSPLHFAARNGNEDVVDLLLKNGAMKTLNLQTREGETALHIAATKGRMNALSILITNGAALEIRDVNNETALLRSTLYPMCAELLIDAGADISAKDKMLRTPLAKATSLLQIETVKSLLSKGADIEALDVDNRTPLHLAAVTGNVEMIKVLLDNGACTTRVDKRGKTPLSICLDRGHLLGASTLREFDRLLEEEEARKDREEKEKEEEEEGGATNFESTTREEEKHAEQVQVQSNNNIAG